VLREKLVTELSITEVAVEDIAPLLMGIYVPERPVVRAPIELCVLAVDLDYRKQLAEVFFLAYVLEMTRAGLAQWTDLAGLSPLFDASLAENANLARVAELWIPQETEALADYASEHVLDRVDFRDVSDPAVELLLHLSELFLGFCLPTLFFMLKILLRCNHVRRSFVLWR